MLGSIDLCFRDCHGHRKSLHRLRVVKVPSFSRRRGRTQKLSGPLWVFQLARILWHYLRRAVSQKETWKMCKCLEHTVPKAGVVTKGDLSQARPHNSARRPARPLLLLLVSIQTQASYVSSLCLSFLICDINLRTGPGS